MMLAFFCAVIAMNPWNILLQLAQKTFLHHIFLLLYFYYSFRAFMRSQLIEIPKVHPAQAILNETLIPPRYLRQNSASSSASTASSSSSSSGSSAASDVSNGSADSVTGMTEKLNLDNKEKANRKRTSDESNSDNEMTPVEGSSNGSASSTPVGQEAKRRRHRSCSITVNVVLDEDPYSSSEETIFSEQVIKNTVLILYALVWYIDT